MANSEFKILGRILSFNHLTNVLFQTTWPINRRKKTKKEKLYNIYLNWLMIFLLKVMTYCKTPNVHDNLFISGIVPSATEAVLAGMNNTSSQATVIKFIDFCHEVLHLAHIK